MTCTARQIATYKAIAAEHGRPSEVLLMRDLHIAADDASIDPNWIRNVSKVWQDYDAIGSKADRDELSNEVIFGGKEVDLREFTPNRAIVGTPADCISEMERIRDKVNPDYVLMTPTGVPDFDQHWAELRLFAREVMPHFR